MYNVIIMDRNRSNRQKIRHHLDDVKDLFKIIGEAASSDQAENLLRRRDVDLIIGDDAMTPMTGLQLFNQNKETYPKLHMVLMTDYRKYSQSKETLAQGRLDYLYKPVRKNDVVDSLRIMARRLDQSRELSERQERMKLHYENNTWQFQELFFMNLIYGSVRKSPYIYDRLDYFGIPHNEAFAVAVFKIDDYRRYELALEEEDKQFLVFRIYDTIRRNMEDNGWGITFISRFDEVTMLFTTVSETMDILDACQKCHDSIQEDLDIQGTIGIGRLYDSPDMMHLSYNQAVDAVLEHNYLGKGTVIHIDFVTSLNDLAYAYAPELDTMLIKYMLAGHQAQALKTLTKILNALESKDLYNKHFYRAFINNLTAHLYRDGMAYGYDLETALKEHLPESQLDSIQDSTAALSHLTSLINIVADYVTEEKLDQDELLLENALKYIQAYYTSRISLASAAQYLQTTPKHLEEIIYKVYNQNFYDFCMMVRVENAKDLLIRSRQSTAEIALASGFNNTEYFVAIFKKYTNTTPSEYRHQNRNTSDLPLTLMNNRRSQPGYVPSDDRH